VENRNARFLTLLTYPVIRQ